MLECHGYDIWDWLDKLVTWLGIADDIRQVIVPFVTIIITIFLFYWIFKGILSLWDVTTEVLSWVKWQDIILIILSIIFMPKITAWIVNTLCIYI